MALNIDLDGFGFLESDTEASKLSPLNKQPPISPIESESSSGISSLDSDDLKKQLLSSPPTISQEDHDDDESEQSDSGSSTSSSSSSSESDVSDKSDIKNDSIDVEAIKVDDAVPTEPIYPTQVLYENRNVLNLANNVWYSGRFIQYTVLPENNVNCFFQNRAQYWRLANNNANHDAIEKCSCCDFSYPPEFLGQLGKGGAAAAKNSITESLMTFLKSNIDHQSPPMPNVNNNNNNHTVNNPSMPVPAAINNNMSGGHQGPNRRMFNGNNNAPYAAAYQMMQQQQQQQQHYPSNNQSSGYYGTSGNAGFNQMNNNGYNGTALALLNLMNASRNVSSAGAAFQATLNNSTRYFNNNNMNTNNNGFGLYKQF